MRSLLLVPVLALAAGMLIAPVPAAGQCRLCDTPTTKFDSGGAAQEVSLDIETSLDFDRLVLLAVGEGTATLLPDGSRSATGVVGDISGRAMAGSGRLRGEPGRAVRVELPRVITLHSLSGGRLTIENIVSDLPPAPRLDSAGSLEFRFGGRLRISGDAEGDYRGDIPITAEYL